MNRLFRPTSPATLAAFRILFGGLMVWEVVRMWANHKQEFPAWEFWALYDSIEFVRSWPRLKPDTVFPLLTIAAVGIALGLMTRLAATVFCALYVYQFLFDPTHFNNHYYLISLFSFWLIVVRSHALWSLDGWLRPAAIKRDRIPWWHIGIFQIQLVIVYFYGGLAKLRGDWLRAEPVHPWLAAEAGKIPLIGPWLAEKSTAYFVAYFGLVFDLCIPFLLLYRKTRPYAIIVAILFHLMNSQLFAIGVFPFMGVASLIVFLEPETPARLVAGLKRGCRRFLGLLANASDAKQPVERVPIEMTPSRYAVVGLLSLYLVVQLLLPFRHFLYGGDVEWTEEAKHFSWRMMLSHKETFVGIRVVDSATGLHFEVDQGGALAKSHGLTPGKRAVFVHQLHPSIQQPIMVPEKLLSRRHRRGKGVWGNPRLLAQYACYLAEEARKLGMRQPQVYTDAVASLNGRPFQYLVDPDTDLAQAPSPLFSTPAWIVPLEPNQPIGNYTSSLQEMYDRVMPVIEKHHQRNKTR